MIVSAQAFIARVAPAASRVVRITYCSCLHKRLLLVILFLRVVHCRHLSWGVLTGRRESHEISRRVTSVFHLGTRQCRRLLHPARVAPSAGTRTGGLCTC